MLALLETLALVLTELNALKYKLILNDARLTPATRHSEQWT